MPRKNKRKVPGKAKKKSVKRPVRRVKKKAAKKVPKKAKKKPSRRNKPDHREPRGFEPTDRVDEPGGREEGQPALPNGLLKDVREIKKLDKDIDELKKEAKEVTLVKDVIQQRVIKTMDALLLPSFRLEGVGNVTRTYIPRCTIIKGHEEKLFADLRKRGMGALVVETVNSRTLTSAVKEIRDKNGKQLKGIEVYDQPALRITKGSKKAK